MLQVGYNRHASRYAGINEKKSIILSMTIAGALAGLGGAVMYLANV
ncbi:ABC transporter permease, partial [Erysipelothrix rhusiopathiae]|nr:ABC transporter permease [Erysipelothrix rhusiopathiae]